MASDTASDDRPQHEEVAEQEQQKAEEVLDREGLEQELMEQGKSHVGEEIDDVE